MFRDLAPLSAADIGIQKTTKQMGIADMNHQSHTHGQSKMTPVENTHEHNELRIKMDINFL